MAPYVAAADQRQFGSGAAAALRAGRDGAAALSTATDADALIDVGTNVRNALEDAGNALQEDVTFAEWSQPGVR